MVLITMRQILGSRHRCGRRLQWACALHQDHRGHSHAGGHCYRQCHPSSFMLLLLLLLPVFLSWSRHIFLNTSEWDQTFLRRVFSSTRRPGPLRSLTTDTLIGRQKKVSQMISSVSWCPDILISWYLDILISWSSSTWWSWWWFPVYIMTVEARDSGGPAKTNTATTRLVIKWANN